MMMCFVISPPVTIISLDQLQLVPCRASHGSAEACAKPLAHIAGEASSQVYNFHNPWLCLFGALPTVKADPPWQFELIDVAG